MTQYREMKRPELKALAESYGLKKAYSYKKQELIHWLEERVSSVEEQEQLPIFSSEPDTSPESEKVETPETSETSEGSESEETVPSPVSQETGSSEEGAHSGGTKEAPAWHTTSSKLYHRPGHTLHFAPSPIKYGNGRSSASNARVFEEKKGSEDETTEPRKPRRNLPSDTGVLEVMSDGYGFLQGEKDDGTSVTYYVPATQIRRFNLKSGDIVEGVVGDTYDKDKYPPIIFINSVNGMNPTDFVRRDSFDDLTPIYPDERIRLETVKEGISNRIVDLIAPVGRGQRGLIVSPPKAGKTTLLKSIAQAIELTYPQIYLFILLIDERPEEVTDFEESVNRMRNPDDSVRTEVVASTFDKPAQNHTKTAEDLLERAKRLVEGGQDVVILLDSLTRLSRAYNIVTTPSGRTLSGGLDPVALYPPKSFFGAARNIRGAGSLTILATCLKDTGSRMDDMIYEEFKGTGNMEVHLSRSLSEMRIFPAIDIFASGTRRDDLLLTREEQNAMLAIRKQGRNSDETAVMEQFVRLMKHTDTNEEFCRIILSNQANAMAIQ